MTISARNCAPCPAGTVPTIEGATPAYRRPEESAGTAIENHPGGEPA